MKNKLVIKDFSYIYNDGTEVKGKKSYMQFIGIELSMCGCGGNPKIIQRGSGKPYYDYCGETFTILCDKCGIRLPEELNNK